MITLTASLENTGHVWREVCERSRPPLVRKISTFAEEEIIIPGGEYKNSPYRIHRQPHIRHWFDAIDAGVYREFLAIGNSQSGKTLQCWCIPTLWHLFEHAENVVAAVPDDEMVWDKWREDLKPVIEKTRYRDLLPRVGSASRDGRPGRSIQFGNGATLRFMTAGGGDKSRSAFETRVLVITEADWFDRQLEASTEASMIHQLEARLRSHRGHRRRIYKEGTLTIREGHLWANYAHNSTGSQVVLCCPQCRLWVLPEREQLRGWETADDQEQAEQNTHFVCPSCNAPWSEDERRDACADSRLLHAGQTMEGKGKRAKPTGVPRSSFKFGFRWSAVHNQLLSAGDFGVDEFDAQREVDPDDAERKLCQFVWAIPYEPPEIEKSVIVPGAMEQRMRPWSKGVVPPDTQLITVGKDMGKRECWWVALAYLSDHTFHIFDYGATSTRCEDLGLEQGITETLDRFGGHVLETGWVQSGTGQQRIADQFWIDSGWMPDAIRAWTAGQDHRTVKAMFGRGAGQHTQRTYHKPKRTGGHIVWIGEQMHISYDQLALPSIRNVPRKAPRTLVAEVNADHYKLRLHECLLSEEPTTPGYMTVYKADPKEHQTLWKHLAAEHYEVVYDAKVGIVGRFVRDRKINHLLDALYIALAAATFMGAGVAKKPAKRTKTPGSTSRAIGARGAGGFLANRRGGNRRWRMARR